MTPTAKTDRSERSEGRTGVDTPETPISDSSYWALPPAELLHELDSSREGLGGTEAARRLVVHGRNMLARQSRRGIVSLFLHQFSNPLVLILVVAAVVSLAVRESADASVILVVLLGSALLTLAQEYSASTAIERLRHRLVLKAAVLRDGTPREIPAEEVVPGDIVLVAAGDLVPADGVLLEARDLFLNQGALTGESIAVEKSPDSTPPTAPLTGRTNVLFMGTSVRSGSGRFIVVATGTATVYGTIARRLAVRGPETEFERGIRRFGYLLARITLLLVIAVFAANVFLDRPPVDSLLFAIALAVGISPELLPAIISVTLAKGAREMAAGGVLVRRLNAIEDFGSMDVLCADKTGTLTEGVLRLHAAVDAGGDPSPAVLEFGASNAHLQTGMRNPLDEALLAARPEPPVVRRLDEIPYDFERRRVTIVVEDAEGQRLLTKGAVTQILAVCTTVREDGELVPLTPDRRVALEGRMARWGGEGYRVLGVATRQVPQQERYHREEERDLTFEGYLLFIDAPKDGIEGVLEGLRSLGVRVVMITGDNRYVARHVARRVGLDETSVLTGAEIGVMPDEAMWHRVGETAVFAEVDPSQKERILRALQKRGHVVGYLGDGINDAPALHAADVGISVDSAADVARESADFVLLERNLDVLRGGILMGRRTFANTLKYVHITTSANFGNMVSMAAASLFLPFLPLLASQILLNNFLSDLPALAVAGDRVDEDWTRRPQRWDIRPIERFMLVFGLVSSVFDILTFALLLLVFSAGPELFRTGWFVVSLLTELVVIFVVRTRAPFPGTRASRALIWIAVVTGIVAVSLPFTPVGPVFQLVPLPPAVLGTLLLLTLGFGVATEVAKRWFSQAK